MGAPSRDRASRQPPADAVSITTAAPSAAEDVAARQRRYLFSMGLRTVCFIGAVVVGPGILRWVLIVGAVFLPYVAVVLANTTVPRKGDAEVEAPDIRRRQLRGPDRTD